MRENKLLTYEEVWAIVQENAQQLQETRRIMQETFLEIRQTQKETNKAISELGERFGELAEHLVAPNILEKFRALNFSVKRISQNIKIKNDQDKQDKTLAEIDLLLENGDTAIAVEVKAKLKQKDVDDHIRRMEVLRKEADARGDSRKYRGAVAGAIMGAAVRDYAHKKGFYVIEQTGDTVKIDMPKGFKPREW